MSSKQGGNQAVFRVETGERLQKLEGGLRRETTVGIAGLYILPEELLGRVNEHGLVIVQKGLLSDEVFSLLPGELLGREPANVLYASRARFGEGRSFIKAVTARTKPVVVVVT